MYRDETEIISCEVEENYQTEIQKVEGLSASKSDLSKFESLDELVETNSREMIDSILQQNLRHSEIRIIHMKGIDCFVTYSWDSKSRLFLSNSGGSHHFSAARYIASRIDEKVPLNGKLLRYYIDRIKLATFLDSGWLYVFSNEEWHYFHQAMEKYLPNIHFRLFNIPHCSSAVEEQVAVLLPDSPKIKKVQNKLDSAGFFNLSSYLYSVSH